MSACTDKEYCFHNKAQHLRFTADISAGPSGPARRQLKQPLTRAQFPASRYAPPAIAIAIGVFLLSNGLTWSHFLLFALCTAVGVLWFRSVRGRDRRAARVGSDYHEGNLRLCGGCDHVLRKLPATQGADQRFEGIPRAAFAAWMRGQGARYPADPAPKPGPGLDA